MDVKRIVVASLLALVAVLVVAAPAFAQQDPFEPVTGGSGSSVDDSSGDPFDPATGTDRTTTDTDTDTSTGGSNVDGTGTTTVEPESLPNTGAESTSWAAIAYILIAVGGAFVLLARVHAPVRRR